jgi:hypothetical protein
MNDLLIKEVEGYLLVVKKDFLRVTLVCDDSLMEAHSVEHRLYCSEPIGIGIKIQCFTFGIFYSKTQLS